MKQIVIYDDDSGIAKDYAARLSKLPVFKENFSIVPMSQEKFIHELGVLKKRQKASRDETEWKKEPILVDETSIFIVDFDLIYTDSFLTGEEVAYMLRCFSECGLIIGLNRESRKRVQKSHFDLTLKGHPDSFCDLNIDASQLDNLGLWSDYRNGFRPWHWPQLLEYLGLFEQKIDSIKKNPDGSIVNFLQFEEILQLFSGESLEFLGNDPENITFNDFVVNSSNGLRGKDKTNEEIIPRIAAARISKWLERLVLPGQDILIDAPHLISRFPSLFIEDPQDREKLNETTNLSNQEFPIDFKKIDAFKFKNDFWLSRPVWFWNEIYKHEEIEEVKEPWKSKELSYVFCEDSSTFEKRESCIEFKATFDSPYNQRFVRKDLKDVEYAPKVLLL